MAEVTDKRKYFKPAKFFESAADTSLENLNLRDLFACFALLGLLDAGGVGNIRQVISNVYRVADEMIAQREK